MRCTTNPRSSARHSWTEFYIFFWQDSAPAHRGSWNRRAAKKSDSRLHSTHTLATKQPWLKSGGLQDLVSWARKGLSKPNWRRWWVARAAWEELNQRIIGTAVRQWRTRLHACVKAWMSRSLASNDLDVHGQGKRRPLWAQAAL